MKNKKSNNIIWTITIVGIAISLSFIIYFSTATRKGQTDSITTDSITINTNMLVYTAKGAEGYRSDVKAMMTFYKDRVRILSLYDGSYNTYYFTKGFGSVRDVFIIEGFPYPNKKSAYAIQFNDGMLQIKFFPFDIIKLASDAYYEADWYMYLIDDKPNCHERYIRLKRFYNL